MEALGNIVLVHGLIGYRKAAGIDYFRDVPKLAERQFGAGVYKAYQRWHETTEERAWRLGAQLVEWWKQCGRGRPIHLVAHSTGGIDARCLLSPRFRLPPDWEEVRQQVRSLATIGTPHHGSFVADLICDPSAGLHFPGRKALMQSLTSVLTAVGFPGERLPDMSTAAIAEFNRLYPNSPAVRYLSVAGTGRRGLGRRLSLLAPLYEYLSWRSQEPHDGLVHLSSATWGEGVARRWPADHFQEVGYEVTLWPFEQFDHLAGYERLFKELTDDYISVPKPMRQSTERQRIVEKCRIQSSVKRLPE